jgi:hypothetical protein
VGTVRSAVNQGEVILTGQATGATWVRIVINHLVPFTSVGAVLLRTDQRAGGPGDFGVGRHRFRRVRVWVRTFSPWRLGCSDPLLTVHYLPRPPAMPRSVAD